MGDAPDKIKWHPAFYAATELELQENIEQLELKTEYNLSKEPIRAYGTAQRPGLRSKTAEMRS